MHKNEEKLEKYAYYRNAAILDFFCQMKHDMNERPYMCFASD